MRQSVMAGAILLGLAACGQMPESPGADRGVAGVVATADVAAMDAAAPAAEMAEPAPPPGVPQGIATTGRDLAYEHSFALEVPGDAVQPLQDAQAADCRTAGPAKCLVIASGLDRSADGSVHARLQMRMLPGRIEAFRAALQQATGAARGEIVSAETTSEDLTQVIVDTEAMLRTRSALRERLLALLGRQSGKVADLLEVERELARVQQEIDAATSAMKVYRLRVDMALVTVAIRSERSSVGGDVGSPLGDALRDFVRIMAQSAAIIVRLVAGLLPVLLAGGIVAIVALQVWRRWKAGKSPPVS